MKFEFHRSSPQGLFEGTSLSDWQDWKWQLRNALKNVNDFSKVYELTSHEIAGFEKSKDLFQIRTTPYYASLGDPQNELDPLRLIQTPQLDETRVRFQEMLDPLGEEKNSVNHRLIHRYADRALFLVTDFCTVYCRFCTRKRFTGQHEALISPDDYKNSLAYLQSHSEIREVILSGGDPLTLSDDQLEKIFSDLRQIEHIEIIRVGSRMPVVNPFRITSNLVAIFKKYKPVYLMNHFNHPRELTFDAAEALDRIADAGVPMMNQMVLLNGINNHAVIVQALSRRLLFLRVKPYYMFQCDPSLGTDHLRTSISNSLDIQKELWGHLSGLAMPNFSIDIPHGGGKAPMVPSFLRAKPNGDLHGRCESHLHDERDKVHWHGESDENVSGRWNFKGFDGIESEYVDPSPESIRKPIDVHLYEKEWIKK